MLFKDTDKIIEFAQIASNSDFTDLKKTLQFVETQHIIPVLGPELYTALEVAYTASTNDDTLTSPELTTLLLQCRRIVGPYLCYYHAPKADVLLSGSGLQRVETTTNKTAYQYQNTNFAQANLHEAEACTETLIEFLEEKKDDYPLWIDSAAFKKYRSLFIKSGKEFGELFPSHTPYRNFYALRAKMEDVEENNIRELLGDTMFDALKAKDKDINQPFTPIELQLLRRIKKIIASLSVAFAIPMLNTRIDANGLSVLAAASFSTSDKENTRGGADKQAVSELVKACMASAETAQQNTIRFLKANPLEFTTWIGFATPAMALAKTTINDDLKASFGLL